MGVESVGMEACWVARAAFFWARVDFCIAFSKYWFQDWKANDLVIHTVREEKTISLSGCLIEYMLEHRGHGL